VTTGTGPQRPWRYEDAKKGAFVYNKEQNIFEFIPEDGGFDIEEPLYNLMDEYTIEVRRHHPNYKIGF
jgi:hypothetical protein